MQNQRIPVNYGLPKIENLIPYVLNPFELLHQNQFTHQDIVEIKFRLSSMFLLTNPTLIEEVLVHKYKHFRKDVFLRERAAAVFGNGLLTSDGDVWLRHRRMMQPAFHKQRIAEYATTMANSTAELLAQIPRNTYIDIHELMLDLTLTIVGQTLFSTSKPEHMEKIKHALHAIMQRFGNNNWLNIIEQITGVILNRKLYRAYEVAIAQLNETIDEIIAERLSYTQQPNDLLGMMIDSRDDEGQPMSREQLRDECKTLFLAGHETTALNVSWTMYLIHLNPKVQLRLQRELRHVLHGERPTYDAIPQLLFTEKVIRESLRMKPPAWLTQREALTDIEIGGYLIPAGKNVAMSPYAIHYDPR